MKKLYSINQTVKMLRVRVIPNLKLLVLSSKISRREREKERERERERKR